MIFLSKQKSTILLFHRVTPVRDKMWDPMDPALFENILGHTQKKYNVLPLEELLFSPPLHSSKPLAAITFDDGYRDFIEYSIPILEKYSMPAHMFIVTGCIDNNIPTWTFVIDYLFEHTKKLSLENFTFPSINGETGQLSWNNGEERIRYGKHLKQKVKWIPANERNSIIEKLLSGFNDVKSPHGMMMSWEEVRQVSEAGFGIGSHSVSHETMATIADDVLVLQELELSRRVIKEKAGIETDIFSYPCGSYDNRVKELTQRAGYRAALAVDQQLYNPAKDELYAIPRIELYNESWIKTRSRINGSMSLIKNLLHR